jgi:hypothetical protein
MRCGRCRGPYYCSRVCQKADWLVHKQVCGILTHSREEYGKVTRADRARLETNFIEEDHHRARVQLKVFYEERVRGHPGLLLLLVDTRWYVGDVEIRSVLSDGYFTFVQNHCAPNFSGRSEVRFVHWNVIPPIPGGGGVPEHTLEMRSYLI